MSLRWFGGPAASAFAAWSGRVGKSPVLAPVTVLGDVGQFVPDRVGELGAQPVPLFWSEIHRTRVHACGWFDPERPLVAAEEGTPDHSSVLVSRDAADRVRGVVGWNACGTASIRRWPRLRTPPLATRAAWSPPWPNSPT